MLQEVDLPVEGMTCERCAAHVTAALRQVPGVTAADVSLERRSAHVAFDSPQADEAVLRRAVEQAGYQSPVDADAMKSPPAGHAGRIAAARRFTVVAEGGEAASVVARAATAAAKRTFAIEGMHCASCVGRVEQALKSAPGVVVGGSQPRAARRLGSLRSQDVSIGGGGSRRAGGGLHGAGRRRSRSIARSRAPPRLRSAAVEAALLSSAPHC